MSSTSGNDGSYSLNVTFAVGSDPDINTVNVQNRVQLAQSSLPEEVRRQGLDVRQQSTAFLQLVSIVSATSEPDLLFLTNYARINMHEALGRVPGVGKARLFSQYAYRQIGRASGRERVCQTV